MKNFTKWQKIIFFSVTYLLVACVASLLTYAFFIGGSDDGMTKLQQLSNLIHSNYIGQLDETDLYDSAAAGMVAGTGDRWSYYVSADQMDDHNAQKNNAYVGVGITITPREDGKGADIVQVEPGGSAKEQGVLPGDILYKAEDQLVGEIGLDEAGKIIKGEIGSTVKITVLRGEEELEFTLTRKQIQTEVAHGQMLENKIGYIRIDTHEDNYVMQNALAKQGFRRCGIIYVEDGTTRIAYDRLA